MHHAEDRRQAAHRINLMSMFAFAALRVAPKALFHQARLHAFDVFRLGLHASMLFQFIKVRVSRAVFRAMESFVKRNHIASFTQFTAWLTPPPSPKFSINDPFHEYRVGIPFSARSYDSGICTMPVSAQDLVAWIARLKAGISNYQDIRQCEDVPIVVGPGALLSVGNHIPDKRSIVNQFHYPACIE